MTDGSQLGIIKPRWKNVEGQNPGVDVAKRRRYSCLGQITSILLHLPVCIMLVLFTR